MQTLEGSRSGGVRISTGGYDARELVVRNRKAG